MFIDWNLDTPPEEINATPLSYYGKWVEEIAMGKLWWFAMFVIVCVIFPVVAVITIGIILAFIMGGSALWHRDTNTRRPAWLADGFIGRSPQSLSVLYFRWWFFFGWRSFVPSSWAGPNHTSLGRRCWSIPFQLFLISRWCGVVYRGSIPRAIWFLLTTQGGQSEGFERLSRSVGRTQKMSLQSLSR